MTKAELLKAIEPYPDDSQVAYQDEDGEYQVISDAELVEGIDWMIDLVNARESKPSIILRTGRWWK